MNKLLSKMMAILRPPIDVPIEAQTLHDLGRLLLSLSQEVDAGKAVVAGRLYVVGMDNAAGDFTVALDIITRRS